MRIVGLSLSFIRGWGPGVFVVFLLSCGSTRYSIDSNERLLRYCSDKALRTLAGDTLADRLPVVIAAGKSGWTTNGIGNWRSGFWPGIEWYLYESTGDELWKNAAARSSARLAAIIDTAVANHDLGFQFYCSFGNGYRLTHDPAYRTILLRAADSLATLFDPRVGTILSWPARVKEKGWPHNTIIDNMMNLELLFWAAKNGGGQHLYDMAVRHAETTMKNHFRPDYSSYHVLVYDTSTGAVLKKVTHQGFADNSMWARGQAWAIYGFTMAYRETRRPEFLHTAMRAADIFLKRLPRNYIPYWDFDDPSVPAAPRDVSAAAITASALLELSTLCDDTTLSATYRRAAAGILHHLGTSAYLSRDKNNAFLLSSTGNKPAGVDVDIPIIYADYYFLEALLRYRRIAAQ